MSSADEFLRAYESDFDHHRRIASTLEDYVRNGIAGRDYHIHLVSSRAKGVQSVKEKIIRKGYSDPQVEMTDRYGVRVITYYSEQVDPIVAQINTLLVLDPQNCVDKRTQMVSDGRFGYSSVHIVGKVPESANRPWVGLRGVTVEVQVRSLLDQAWAEIEHEVVYKSGIEFPSQVRRRFAAIAANFEILEAEFLTLRELSWELVDRYCASYRSFLQLNEAFDAARLIAALECLRTRGIGWRAWAANGDFAAVTPRQALQLLREIGISNALELTVALEEAEVGAACRNLAALQGCSEAELSHVTVVGAVAGVRNWDVLERHLPGLAGSSEMLEAFGRGGVGG